MSAMPRLLIVDDDPFTLATLKSTFESLGVSEVTAFRTAAEAITHVTASPSSQHHTVAVLDLDLGEGPTGIDLALRLRQIVPQIGIVILSTYSEPRLMGVRQPALPPDALYLVKQSIDNPQMLLDAVLQSVSDGSDDSSPSQAPTTQHSREPINKHSRLGKLRDNQVEIMRLVASGLTNAQIAQQLLMTEKSVEKSVARLIKQLGIATSREYNQRVLIAQEYHRMTRGPRGGH